MQNGLRCMTARRMTSNTHCHYFAPSTQRIMLQPSITFASRKLRSHDQDKLCSAYLCGPSAA